MQIYLCRHATAFCMAAGADLGRRGEGWRIWWLAALPHLKRMVNIMSEIKIMASTLDRYLVVITSNFSFSG